MLLEGQLPKKDVDRIAHALGLVVGTEAVIALTDAVGLDYPMAKKMGLLPDSWVMRRSPMAAEGQCRLDPT